MAQFSRVIHHESTPTAVLRTRKGLLTKQTLHSTLSHLVTHSRERKPFVLQTPSSNSTGRFLCESSVQPSCKSFAPFVFLIPSHFRKCSSFLGRLLILFFQKGEKGTLILKMRYRITTPEQLESFRARFIPDGCTVRLPEEDELPLDAPKEGTVGVYTIYFEQAGFRLPLDPLLVDVMRVTKLSLGQLSPNAIRVIMGCSELNRRLKVTLTHREIFYCYTLCKCPKPSDGLYLRARTDRPDLVKCLTQSEKDYNKDIVVVGGNWRGKEEDGTDVVGIFTHTNSNFVSPKSPPNFEVDFGAINKSLKYNGVDLSDAGKHL